MSSSINHLHHRNSAGKFCFKGRNQTPKLKHRNTATSRRPLLENISNNPVVSMTSSSGTPIEFLNSVCSSSGVVNGGDSSCKPLKEQQEYHDIWTNLSLPMKLLLEQWGVPLGAELPLPYVNPRLEYAFLMDLKTAEFDLCLKVKAFQLICSGDSSKSCIITLPIIPACRQCKSLLNSIDLTDEQEETSISRKRSRTSH